VSLQQVNSFECNILLNILIENSRWLAEKGVYQWPEEKIIEKQDEIKVSIDEGRYFKFESSGEIAAIVEINTLPEEIWNNDNSNAYYIHKLAIRRKFSNQRLGWKVLNLIKLKAEKLGIGYLRLDCISHNENLCRYYETFGFHFKGKALFDSESLALYEYKIKI